MLRIVALVAVLLCVTPAFAQEGGKTEEQKTIYAIGLALAKNISVFNLTPEEFANVQQGLVDGFSGKKTDVELSAYGEKLQQLARARRKASGEKMADLNKNFAENAAKEKGAVKTASGAIYLPLAEGKGDSPKGTDRVKVNYRGTLPDGKEFDSSYKRNKPIEFRLDGVIKCWTEGLQMMKPGGKAKLVCPASTAYGENGAGELILPGATLQFEVELLEVMK
ncbi:MAG TPA: FKBP-type peptidyl-prolyl cis-trans isomerase [Geobacteraceae bacterium]|nr:FKBP-type peptidyl-prolyl cis-trans isomerase [Geobacteraceae bacterium]